MDDSMTDAPDATKRQGIPARPLALASAAGFAVFTWLAASDIEPRSIDVSARGWIHTDAKVVGSATVSVGGSDPPYSCTISVAYEYRAGAQQYVNGTVWPGKQSTENCQYARSVAARLQAGAVTSVYYEQERPWHSVLDSRRPKEGYGLYVTLLFALLTLISIVLAVVTPASLRLHESASEG
jgi:hypothetical protein